MVVLNQQTSSEDQIHDFPLLSDLFHWAENGSKKSTLKDIFVISNGKKVTFILFILHYIFTKILILNPQEIPDDCPNAVEIIRKPRSAQKPKSQEDLDLTGSPLKASFTLEDNDDEHDDFEGDVVVKRNKGPSFYPLHTETAR